MRDGSPAPTCDVLCVTCQISHFICHISHVIHFFFFFCLQCGEVSRWRVCYQRGLPLLVCPLLNQNFCRTQEGPAYMRLSRFRPYVRTSVRPYVRTSVRPYVRLHIRFQFYLTRSIYLGPPIFLQIPDLLCIDY